MIKLEQKILKFIARENLIAQGDNVLVALSGGPDSVFALHFLLKYKKKFRIEISAFHLNHKLRGRESEGDEKFCSLLCASLGVSLFSESADIKKLSYASKTSIEETARGVRYRRLEELARIYRFDKIVTAHNSNDNAETMLLNLFTGCGLHGISGIPARRSNIIRPLLSITKEEILEYLKENKIKYRTDSSNLSDDYKRNFLRNRIIPHLKKEFNPLLEDALFRSSRIFEQGKNSLDRIAEELLSKEAHFSAGRVSINISSFTNSVELLGAMLRSAIQREFSKELTFEDYALVKELLNKQTGKRVHLSSGLVALKERERIEIFRPGKALDDEFRLKIGENIEIGGFRIGIENGAIEEGNRKNFEKSELIEADNTDDIFILRKWKSGDKFIPLGMKGFKKISDFLTDAKVPSSEKRNRLILLNRNNIVWVCGLRIDDRFKITDKTKKTVRLWIQKIK